VEENQFILLLQTNEAEGEKGVYEIVYSEMVYGKIYIYIFTRTKFIMFLNFFIELHLLATCIAICYFQTLFFFLTYLFLLLQYTTFDPQLPQDD